MVELAEIQAIYYVIAARGSLGTLLTAIIGVRSYLNANKRAEESKKKEQETRDRELETRQAQMFLNVYDQTKTEQFITAYNRVVIDTKWNTYEE